MVEDASGSAQPQVPVFERLCAVWGVGAASGSAAFSIGWDPTYGRQLVAGLAGCGLIGVGGLSYRRQAPGGQIWETVTLGLQRLHHCIVKHAADKRELAQALEVGLERSFLYDHRSADCYRLGTANLATVRTPITFV